MLLALQYSISQDVLVVLDLDIVLLVLPVVQGLTGQLHVVGHLLVVVLHALQTATALVAQANL